MSLSSKNENYKKLHLVEEDKRIEALEKDLYSDLDEGYLGVMNKCSQLEKFNEKVKNLKITNENYHSFVQDKIMRISEIEEDYGMLNRGIRRIEEIRKEIEQIDSFLEAGCLSSKMPSHDSNDLEIYNAVKNMKIMKNTLKNIQLRAKSSFYENLKQKVKQWNTNTVYIGAGTLGCAFSSHFKIFSPLTQAKSLLLNTEFLKILYGAEELALQPLITDEINELREDALHKTDMPTITNKNNNYREDRLYSTTKNNKRGIESSVNDTMNTETNKSNLTKEDKIISGVLSDMEHRDLDARNAFTEREISHIFKKANGDEIYEKYIRMNTEMIYERAETLGDEKYVGTMQYFYFLVGQLMMSAYLQNVLSDIQTFYTEIVGLFDHARFYDLKVIKMVVVPLKRIFSELELDAEELDRILNKIVYAYIAKLFKDKPISEFPSAIEESISLLNVVAQYFTKSEQKIVKIN